MDEILVMRTMIVTIILMMISMIMVIMNYKERREWFCFKPGIFSPVHGSMQ